MEALAHPKPRRRRPKEAIIDQIGTLEQRILAESDPLAIVKLVQTKLDLTTELSEMIADENRPDATDFEEDFVTHAKEYSERKGLTYQAWRHLGVPAQVLRRAGITDKGTVTPYPTTSNGSSPAPATAAAAAKATKASGATKKAPRDPEAAEIRAWGKANGFQMPERGRIPAVVKQAYQAAKS